jgi:hypothetical protein
MQEEPTGRETTVDRARVTHVESLYPSISRSRRLWLETLLQCAHVCVLFALHHDCYCVNLISS